MSVCSSVLYSLGDPFWSLDSRLLSPSCVLLFLRRQLMLNVHMYIIKTCRCPSRIQSLRAPVHTARTKSLLLAHTVHTCRAPAQGPTPPRVIIDPARCHSSLRRMETSILLLQVQLLRASPRRRRSSGGLSPKRVNGVK